MATNDYVSIFTQAILKTLISLKGANKGLGPGVNNNNPDSLAPRNQSSESSVGGGGGGGTVPSSTPVPDFQSIFRQRLQQHQMGNQNSLNPSPTAMMGVVPSGSGPGDGFVGGTGGLGGPQTDLNMIGHDFMNNTTNSLWDFTGAADLFGTGADGDIDFERDYVQWYNPDNVVNGPDFMNNVTISDSLQDDAGTADLFEMLADSDIDFERDYAQWFNPDDVGSTLETNES